MMEVAEVSRTKFDPYVIGNNIRDLREKRKMTLMKAAEEMDMSLFFSSFYGFGVKIAARCPQVAIFNYWRRGK